MNRWCCSELEKLGRVIEAKRKKLNEHWLSEGAFSSSVIKLSQELDVLINQYEYLKKKNC